MTINRDVIAVFVEKINTDVYVPRFSAFMITAIMKRAEELYPLPDTKPYEEAIPDAVVPGTVIPAAQHPEYQKLLTQVMLKRNQHLQNAVLGALTVKGITREEIVAAFFPIIEPMRQYAELPEDAFVAVMRYCVLSTTTYREIMDAATKDQALSQEEIRDGMSIFRRVIQRDAAGGAIKEQGASDLQEGEQVQAQQSA